MSAPARKYYGVARTNREYFWRKLGTVLLILIIVLALLLPSLEANAQSGLESCPEFEYDSARSPVLLMNSFESLGGEQGYGTCQIRDKETGELKLASYSTLLALELYSAQEIDYDLTVRWAVVSTYGWNEPIESIIASPTPLVVHPESYSIRFIEYDWPEGHDFLDGIALATIFDAFSKDNGAWIIMPNGDVALLVADVGRG